MVVAVSAAPCGMDRGTGVGGAAVDSCLCLLFGLGTRSCASLALDPRSCRGELLRARGAAVDRGHRGVRLRFAARVSALMFLGFVPETIASLTPVHFTNIGFLALFLGMRAQINRFREAQSEALALRERQAREEAESARQAELSRLIHDEILSVFTAALALDGTPPRALRSAAQHALDLSSPPASPGLLLTADSMRSCEQVSTDLLVALRHIDSTLHTDMSQTPGWLPEAVGTALTLAAIEALRNSVQHAGPEARRTLTARFEPNDACVVIADNGVGFDPDRIPAERLGVRSSIVGLMQRAGGDATIRSTPGVGTEVTLLWGR